MQKIKILVVDDSRLARELIINLLSADNEIEVVGEAENGLEALGRVMKLKPNLVTMDINMPVMDGIEAIEHIMAASAVPVLVVTSRGDADTAYNAISKGALEVLPKPDVDPENPEEFIKKIKLLSKVKVISHIRGLSKKKIKVVAEPYEKIVQSDRVVVIASSTGGPKALMTLLSEIPDNFPSPIVIAQHIPDDFIPGMVEWLNQHTKLNVKQGEEGETIARGTVYVSPARNHMAINHRGEIVFKEKKPEDLYSPSCDILMSSVASVFGSKSIGIILTGMGHDGVVGMKRIKETGGITIAQDEETSIIFGMPKVAIDSGCIDSVLPITEIGAEIMKLVGL